RGKGRITIYPATRKQGRSAGKNHERGQTMKSTLKPGLKHRLTYTVAPDKTVPHTFPESKIIASMPEVFATGYMIILMEWACTELLAGHLDAGEGSGGVHVEVSH